MNLDQHGLITSADAHGWRERLRLDERDQDPHQYAVIVSGRLDSMTTACTTAFALSSFEALGAGAFGEDGKYQIMHRSELSGSFQGHAEGACGTAAMREQISDITFEYEGHEGHCAIDG